MHVLIKENPSLFIFVSKKIESSPSDPKEAKKMAKSAVFLLTAVLCFSSLLDFALCESHFYVEGQVYCDTCRAQFMTRISKLLPGSKVRLECHNRTSGDQTYTINGETDDLGTYRLPVDGDHEDDICEVVLVKSPDPDCKEISVGKFLRKSARINLTTNNGIVTAARLANPLGFMKKDPLPECAEVLKEMGVLPSGGIV